MQSTDKENEQREADDATSTQGTISLDEQLTIDLRTLIETKLLVQANSGGGKSWALRRLLEQSHGKVQQIVLDVEGDFRTLREKYDYVIIGKDQESSDYAITLANAGTLALKLLELRAPAIIDLYDFPKPMRRLLVALFVEALVDAPKALWHDCLIVLDEAHIFAPESEDAVSTDAVVDLASLGRKRGFCLVLATQRLSKLAKDAASECNNVLIGRASLDRDRNRASEDLGFTTKAQKRSLMQMQSGQFYAYGPAISQEVVTVQIGQVWTFHPRAGSGLLAATPPPSQYIREIISALGELPQEEDGSEREEKTVAKLQQKIRTLNGELTLARRAAGRRGKSVAPTSDTEGGDPQLLRLLSSREEENRRLRETIERMQHSVPATSDGLSQTLSVQLARIEHVQITGEEKTLDLHESLASARAIAEQYEVDLSVLRAVVANLHRESGKTGEKGNELNPFQPPHIEEFRPLIERATLEVQQLVAPLLQSFWKDEDVGGTVSTAAPSRLTQKDISPLPSMVSSEESFFTRQITRIRTLLSQRERSMLRYLLEHEGHEVSTALMAEWLGITPSALNKSSLKAMLSLPFVSRLDYAGFRYKAIPTMFFRQRFTESHLDDQGLASLKAHLIAATS